MLKVMLMLSGILLGGLTACCADRLPRGLFVFGPPICWKRCLWRTAGGAGLVYLAYAKLGWSDALLHGVVLLAFLLVIAYIDCDCGLIFLNVVAAMAAAALWNALFPSFGPVLAAADAADAAMGFCLGGGMIGVIFCLSGAMGSGDIYFAAVLGLWLGWRAILLMLPLAFFSGAAVGVCLLAAGKKRRCDPIPFAPFLALAAGTVYFYAPALLRVYETLWW